MKNAYILPTGDEIRNGIVLDLDSPEIIRQAVKAFPEIEITRISPILDIEDSILNKISELSSKNPDLIVLIGGSGGGHRHSDSLGKDFTHSALCKFLDKHASREIYGKNGHMWTKLICGKKNNTIIINVPGPFVEAEAAFSAFIKAFSDGKNIDVICLAMATAVFEKYPADAVEKSL